MKCEITNLPELVPDNQQLLGVMILKTLHANGFKVDNVAIEFMPDDGTGERIQIPPALRNPDKN
jgi:hypothetical protein